LRTEGLRVTSRVREGEPAKVIVSEATEDPSITLIVMSTHGRSGRGRWFFGFSSVCFPLLGLLGRILLVPQDYEGFHGGVGFHGPINLQVRELEAYVSAGADHAGVVAQDLACNAA
jgi:hypothetical protein